MGVIQLRGALLCDGSITEGILIVSANASQYDEEGQSKPRVLPTCSVNCCVCSDFVGLYYQVLTSWTNTANRKVKTHGQHVHPQTHTNRNEDVRYVASMSGGAEKG